MQILILELIFKERVVDLSVQGLFFCNEVGEEKGKNEDRPHTKVS